MLAWMQGGGRIASKQRHSCSSFTRMGILDVSDQLMSLLMTRPLSCVALAPCMHSRAMIAEQYDLLYSAGHTLVLCYKGFVPTGRFSCIS